MTDRVKSWLRSLQVRTFPLTLLASMAGFLLAGGSFFTPLALELALWAWVSHSLLFARDVLPGEPTGESNAGGGPTPEALYKLAILELPPWFAGSVLLSYFGPGSTWWSLAFALVFLTSAYAYRIASRVTVWSFIPASISVASVAVFSYFVAAEHASSLSALVAVSVFLAALFWRSWSREIEALRTGGLSFPREVGVEIKSGVLEIPRLSRIYADGLKGAFLVVSGYAIFGHVLKTNAVVASPMFLGGVMWAVLVGFAVGFGDLVATSQPWSEKKLVAWVGIEELLTFLSLLAIPAMLGGWVPMLLLAAVSFTWLTVGNWSVHGISPVELPLGEALAAFRDRIRGLTASERSGRMRAQEIVSRMAENRGVPDPDVKVDDFGVAVTGRRGRFRPPDEIAIDGLFLALVVCSGEEKWETLLAGTVAREFQRYLSFLGGANAPTSVGVGEAELEETGWSEEELQGVEEELDSRLKGVERESRKEGSLP